jgi:glycosyltransferase involved in cell wall biosynthesis
VLTATPGTDRIRHNPPASQMPSICLTMIVKDEAAVIERCLESVRGLVDTWVICDTGSTDGTQEVIRASLGDLPGALHERPWVDFGHNRTELMELAHGHADYLLLIDADMTVTYDRARLRDLTADSYMLRHADDPEYWIKRLVRGDGHWRYVGSTHEYITTDGVDREQVLDAIVIDHHADGGTRPEKFERDLRLLSRELEQDPDNPRTVFYLAQTLRDLGRIEEALDLYRRRAALAGWEEEVFYARYQVGLLSERAGHGDLAIPALFEAWSHSPRRAEPLYALAWMFRGRSLHAAAQMVADRGVRTPIPTNALFVERWIYEWGLLFEYSIAAYWVGQPRVALDACNRLLRNKGLPDKYRRQTLANREHCIRALGDQTRRSVTSTRARSRRSR